MDPQNVGKKDLKKRIVIGVLAALVILALLFFAVYNFGRSGCDKACNKKLADQEKKYTKKLADQDKKLADCVKAKRPKKVEKKVMKKIIKKDDLLYLKASLLRHLERIILILNEEKINCDEVICHRYGECSTCSKKSIKVKST